MVEIVYKYIISEIYSVYAFFANRVQYITKKLLDYFSIKNILGNVPQSGNICVFVHFDQSNKIDDYVIQTLLFLKNNYKIIFVTNCVNIAQHELLKVQSLTSLIIIRRNVSYDFGAWRDAIRTIRKNSIKLSSYNSILLTNDSNYLIKDLTPSIEEVLQKHHNDKNDVVGLIDSYQFSHHIQSFFISFANNSLKNKNLEHFLTKKIKHQLFKENIIKKYEIGLSQLIKKEMLSYTVLNDYLDLSDKYKNLILTNHLNTLIKVKNKKNQDIHLKAWNIAINQYKNLEHGIPLNPSHELAFLLLEQPFYPYIKCELLISNPLNIINIHSMKVHLSTKENLKSQIIKNVNRRAKNKTPYLLNEI